MSHVLTRWRTKFTILALLKASVALGSSMNESSVDDYLGFSEETRIAVELNYNQLQRFHIGSVVPDSALNLGLLRVGAPYILGGDDWEQGLDCSHFTMKIFQQLAVRYDKYMVTHELKDLVEGNGLHKVAPRSMRTGDLLVYGYYDDAGDWHGHVVILVDANYIHPSGARGLVVGSHGGFGVQFITYPDFPHTYRKVAKLVNVLRPTTQPAQRTN